MYDLLFTLALEVLRTSSKGGDGAVQALWLAPVVAGPAAGGGTYYWVHKRYRNQDATYEFERRSRIEVSNVRSGDRVIGEREKTRDERVEGWEQSSDPRTRVHGAPPSRGFLDGLFG